MKSDHLVLPPGVEPDPEQTEESPVPSDAWCRVLAARLRQGGEALARRPWRATAQTLGQVADRLLDPSDALRAGALDALGATTPLSPAMAARILDGMAADWRRDRLEAAVSAEAPLDRALDAFVPGPAGGLLRARGRPLTLHVGAGNVPGVSATSMVRALLVKSAAWVKPGRDDVALTALVAREAARLDPVLADAVAVTAWPGRSTPSAALDAADLVVVYGGNDTVAALRSRLPATTPLVAYHHRLSLGVVAREALSTAEAARAVADELAGAVAAFDQRGCVSPQLVLVEEGGGVDPAGFARLVAEASQAVAEQSPPGSWTAAEASAVQQARGAAEMRSAADPEVRVECGADLSWTVILDPAATPPVPAVGRTVVIRPVESLDEVPALLGPVGRWAQSVGWAGPGERALGLAESLSALGVTRLCDFGRQAFPPPWWRHDGRLPLEPLVRWTEVDLEEGTSAPDA